MFLRLRTEVNLEFRSRDAAALGLLHVEGRAGAEGVKGVDHDGEGSTGIDKSADGHVAADAGKGV